MEKVASRWAEADPIDLLIFEEYVLTRVKASRRCLRLLVGALLLGGSFSVAAGTWSDDFSHGVLGSDWRGDRAFFSVAEGVLRGVSSEPLPPSPFHRVEVGDAWGDYTVECQINVVTPNLAICTKGALVLRDNGTDGYVFALHVATKTIEVYRLSDNEILLTKDAPLELQRWYLVRAELQGPVMSFFVDGQPVGTVTDERSLSGGVGLAVQDTMETLFDEFRVTGPAIPSNGLELSLGEAITLSWPGSLTNYVLKATSELGPATAWETVTNQPVRIGDRLSVTLGLSSSNRFYMLVPRQP